MDSIYYVYKHIEPVTNEVLYIGSGSKDRAWHYRVSMSRNSEHTEYLNALTEDGYIPSDWVEIVAKCLSKKEAVKLEKELIIAYQPPFNIHKGEGSMIDKDMLEVAKVLKGKGIVGRKAAEELECSVMTAWRYQYVY